MNKNNRIKPYSFDFKRREFQTISKCRGYYGTPALGHTLEFDIPKVSVLLTGSFAISAYKVFLPNIDKRAPWLPLTMFVLPPRHRVYDVLQQPPGVH